MKRSRKFVSILMAMLMLLSCLPAQFALANIGSGVEDYVTYADTLRDVPSNFSGNIWQLTATPENDWSDYKLTVYAMNSVGYYYVTTMRYNINDVVIVSKEDGEFDRDNYGQQEIANFVSYENVIDQMTTRTLARGKSIVGSNSAFEASSDMLSLKSELNAGEEDDEFYYLAKLLGVKKLAEDRAAEWTVAETGAKYEVLSEETGTCHYTTPTGVACPMFSYYFKLKNGQKLTDQSIFPYYDDTNDVHGGGTQTVNEDWTTKAVTDGVCLVGFPKAEVPDQTVNFSVYEADGTTPINLATIKVYNNASMEESALEKTLQTNGEGKATATLPANTTYFYSVEKEGYVTSAYPEDSTNTVAVGAAETNAPIVKLTKESDVEYSVTIKITDADANPEGEEIPVPGATVTIDNVSSATLTTDENGEVTADLKAGKHVVNAEKRGEFEARETAYEFTVVKDSNPTVVVPITPERAEITLPTVKDANGEIVEDAIIVVSKVKDQRPTSAWGESVTYYSSDFGKTIKVPKNTKFVVKVSAPSYTDNTLYLQSDSSAGTYYSDTECNNTVEGTDVSIAKLDAPIYKVEVTQDETDKSLFTAEVTLSNVNTENGAFGLRYDKNLFSLDSFALKSEDQIELFSLAEDATMKENLGPVTQSTGSDSIGYHVFTWRAKWGAISSDGSPADIGNGTFNTMTGAKPVATYQFRLNVGKSANDIRQDSFTVMPYDKTQHGSTIADYWMEIGDSYTEAYTNFLSRAWRYTDDKNKGDKETLEEGRLPEENTVINGVDTKGFYQVYSENTDLNITVSYDVRTVIEYKNFDAKKAGVSFIVTDEKNAPIKDAEVKLYDSEGNALATIKTDLTGIADYPVDTSISDVTIKYVVSRNGYWDYPETDLNSITINRTTPPTSINEYVKMKEKIYHNPILKYADETEVETTKATLAGDKYAYNEKDFHFNVKPAAGMKFNPPATLQLVVEGVKHTANYVKSENVYVVEGQYIIGEATGEADENGFPSNDVIVLIPRSSLVESDDKYTVTALAGTNGTVSYEAGEDGAAKDDTNSDTSKIIIPDIQPNGKTGTITFTAEATYMVEKVFVNGVQIHDYDGKTTFDYSFDKITMDNTIVVTFWDGFTPSTDSIITLIVGDKGTANVTAPETAAVSNTRKVFLKPSASLTFTATPVDEGYLLNAVKKQVNDGVLEDVAPAGDSYTVDAVAGKNVTVYVTFKDKDAEDTFNVFVTSYVASGEGTINPVGVLIYNKYDSPSFVLTAATADWQASGVMIDDTEVTFGRNSTYTYTLTSVEKDTSIGAIFAETAYVVSGIIDYSQNTTIADGRAVTSAATVTFTRDDDGTVVVSKDVGTNRTNATFTADLAPGTWTVKISKAGYLDYIITGFKMEKNPDGMKFGAATQGEGATPKKIVLTVGDVTGRGKAVSLTDAGVIANGLRTGATDKIKARADIDDDGRLQVGDMAYIMKNYGMRYTKQSYDDFVAQP